MAREEIENLDVLVNVVALRLEKEVKAGDTKALKELLWNVPINILSQYAKHEDK